MEMLLKHLHADHASSLVYTTLAYNGLIILARSQLRDHSSNDVRHYAGELSELLQLELEASYQRSKLCQLVLITVQLLQ